MAGRYLMSRNIAELLGIPLDDPDVEIVEIEDELSTPAGTETS
ncbi:hypothetical protein [Nonomuraea sp. GTA35]